MTKADPLLMALKHALRRGYSQGEIGRHAGVSQSVVSRYLTSQTGVSWCTARKLLETCGYRVTRLPGHDAGTTRHCLPRCTRTHAHP